MAGYVSNMKSLTISDTAVCHVTSVYLVVYLDLCECVIVSQRIDQSLDPCPGDEVGLHVQTLKCLVQPQHFTERL